MKNLYSASILLLFSSIVFSQDIKIDSLKFESFFSNINSTSNLSTYLKDDELYRKSNITLNSVKINTYDHTDLNKKLFSNLNLSKIKYQDFSNAFTPCQLYDNRHIPNSGSIMISNLFDNLLNNYILRDILPKRWKSN